MSDPLSPADVRHIDHACDRFEAGWRTGQRPDPADYLESAAGPRRAALLRQLLLLDWEYRRQTGESPAAADYHARFPDDLAVVDGVGSEMSEKAASTFANAHGTHPPAADRGLTTRTFANTRYDLMDVIGQGGIGVVYRSRDHQLGREVAVKVLRAEYRDRPDACRRFVNEARVGSRLQHPAIVPVYDQGWFDDHRPFLTMRLVRGQTLTAVLRERPDPGHDLRRFLGVFERVCQAVAYAHAQGVVHRDLKPANVMIGAFDEVQVMDWGFARQLRTPDGEPPDEEGGASAAASVPPTAARTSHSTVAGTVMGTPAYMSPEQARGESALIDSRTDVFALGAMLCEILTGRPPYAAAVPEDLFRQAEAGDLTDAHRRLEACGADAVLRGLARRCLEPDRDERPADAAEVARQVTDFLRSAEERVRRAEVERAEAQGKVRAERRARRLLLALVAALLLGAGIAAWQAVAADLARRDAEKAQGNETAAKVAAEAKAAETKTVLDFVENRILSAARPKGDSGGLGSSVTLREALEAVLPVVEASFADQPLTEARLRTALGNSFFLLGDAKTAATQYTRARHLYLTHLGPDHEDTLRSTNNLANSYDEDGRAAEGLPLHLEALNGQRAKFGPDHEDTLTSMNSLGKCYFLMNKNVEALETWEEAWKRREAVLGPNHIDTLVTMSNLVIAYALTGQSEKALTLCREVLRRREAILPAGHPDILSTKINLANCYDDLKRYEDALELREQTLPQLKKVFPPGHPSILWGMHNLANSYDKVGCNQKSYDLMKQTLELREQYQGPNHPDTLRSMRMVADSLVKLGRGDEAIPIIDDCLSRAAGQVVHPKLITGLLDLRMRHFEKANDAKACRETAALWEDQKRTDADSLYTAACYRAVAARLTRAADPSAADAEAVRAIAWLDKAVAAGFKDAVKLKGNKDLDDLRDRAEFNRLVADLSTRH